MERINQQLYSVSAFHITRSELELLGISTPRFAYRAYLTPTSFTNLRRLKVIAAEIQATHADEKLKSRLLAGMQDKLFMDGRLPIGKASTPPRLCNPDL